MASEPPAGSGAECRANADTPGYRAVDLKPLQFREHLRGPTVNAGIGGALAPRCPFCGQGLAVGEPGFRNTDGNNGWEITPEGNAVVLEEQMIKVSGNQFDYPARLHTLFALARSCCGPRSDATAKRFSPP